MDTENTKDNLRDKVRKIVKGYKLGEVESKSKVILDRLFDLEEYKKAKKILVYMPYPYEVDINLGMERMFKEKKVALPFFEEGDEMITAGIVKSLKGVQKGLYGVYNNKRVAKKIVPWGKIDLVLVPALAFDEEGYWLGIGNGGYDHLLRYLSKKDSCEGQVRVGLAFSHQVLEHIPHSEKDVPVEKVITEKGVLSFG
jgi:5-formyltetrahydrofolate cyclo-ligase